MYVWQSYLIPMRSRIVVYWLSITNMALKWRGCSHGGQVFAIAYLDGARTWWPDDGSLSEASAAMLANQSCRIRSLIHRQGVAVMVCPYLPWLGRSRSQRERKCLRHGLVSRLRKSLSWSEQRCPLWVLIVPFYHYEWVLFLSRFPGRPFCEHGRVIPENRPKSILYVYLSLLLVKLSTECGIYVV